MAIIPLVVLTGLDAAEFIVIENEKNIKCYLLEKRKIRKKILTCSMPQPKVHEQKTDCRKKIPGKNYLE